MVNWVFRLGFVGALCALVSCGADSDTQAVASTSCSAAYNGIWLGPSGAKVTLDATCAIEFVGSPTCSSTGTYTALLGSSGAMTVEIASRTGGTNCPAPSRFQCAYILSAGLTLDCAGGGGVAYSKVTQ